MSDFDMNEYGNEPQVTLPVPSFFPLEPATGYPAELEPGTVIGFTKRYSEDGPGYSFAAVHVARMGWYLTGPKYAGRPMAWTDLLDFIGEPSDWRKVGVVNTWAPLVP